MFADRLAKEEREPKKRHIWNLQKLQKLHEMVFGKDENKVPVLARQKTLPATQEDRDEACSVDSKGNE